VQAATITALGDIDVLNFSEVPKPSPKAGHVLIKIATVGTNASPGPASRRLCTRSVSSGIVEPRNDQPPAASELNGVSNVP